MRHVGPRCLAPATPMPRHTRSGAARRGPGGGYVAAGMTALRHAGAGRPTGRPARRTPATGPNGDKWIRRPERAPADR
ncbi:unnamed protein product [Acidocella sp. C78]|nr:unnamed protein product [Acidocella sp. C78]